MGGQIESTRGLIAQHRQAIANLDRLRDEHVSLMGELEQQLVQLEALAAEAKSAETEEES